MNEKRPITLMAEGANTNSVRYRLPKKCLLRRSCDFNRLRTKGARIVAGCLLLNWMALPDGAQNKIGVVISKKIGSAVERNRCRRLLKEAYRLHQCDLARPVEIVLVARKGLKDYKLTDVEKDLLKALASAGLLKKDVALDCDSHKDKEP
ncbi:MAG: ribonuclease P protein component [Verrucomicrobiae bacterium]|nr:ribonuclease P protein component [Verrucomicrobiae bacterium]